MSGVEALARVLRAAMTTWAVCVHSEGRCAAHDEPEPCTAPHDVATELLADPGPLLEALAEAGVLGEVYSLARHDPQPMMDGPRVQHAGESPDRSVMERALGLPHSEGRWIERRYVTEWRPTDA